MKKSLFALAALAASGCAVATSRRSWDEQARGHELRAMNVGGLEITTIKGQKADAPQFMPGDGRAAIIHDKAVIPTVMGAGDVVKFGVPGGLKVTGMKFVNGDLDTGANLTVSIGYEPRSANDGSLAANVTYFQADLSTFRAAGDLTPTFVPIKFEQDAYITVTVGTPAAAVGGSVDLHLIVSGIAEGAK